MGWSQETLVFINASGTNSMSEQAELGMKSINASSPCRDSWHGGGFRLGTAGGVRAVLDAITHFLKVLAETLGGGTRGGKNSGR